MIDAVINLQNVKLTGRISVSVALTGNIKTDVKLAGRITPSSVKLSGNVSIPVGYEHYEGNYEATPKISEYTLDTKDKVMYSDFTVKAIPYYEVSNAQGGTTIIIGEE